MTAAAVSLLSSNAAFRRLSVARVVSFVGDSRVRHERRRGAEAGIAFLATTATIFVQRWPGRAW